MKKSKYKIIHCLAVCVMVNVLALPIISYAKEKKGSPTSDSNPVVRLQTTVGNIDIELFPGKAPVSVKNFLGYVESGFYNGTIFHRVIKGFMIQGGGFTSGIKKDNKKTRDPIKNEADNGLKNKTGTIAMARLPQPDSATSQFFINTKDNIALDHRGKNAMDWGYAVFGKVVKGMKVVRNIEDSATTTIGYYQNVPKTEVVISKVQVLNAKKESMKKK